MTFAEYNTDENFNKPSNAMELVKLGKDEGKSKDEILKSLSPLWKEDKKGNVKKALDYHFPEPKKEESIVKEEKVETKPVEKTSNIRASDKAYLERTNAIADEAEKNEAAKVQESQEERWDNAIKQMEKASEGFGKIDDKLVSQLPTFMFKRYMNGEFGDPKSSDSKLRLAHFMINGLGTALSNAGHIINKDGPIKESEYQQYQNTNLQQGLENRWNKYKAETQAAIDLLKNQEMSEQDIMNGIAKISSNNRLQTAFNMMNENQKAYLIKVTESIGDDIGKFDNEKLVNFLIGSAVSGDALTWQEAAEIAGAKFGKDLFKKGKGKLGDLVPDGDEQTAGFGGNGNLKDYETIDGENISFKMFENDEGKAKINKLAQDLSNKYYNGEIDEETFIKYYTPIYEEGSKHIGTKKKSPEKLIQENKQLHQSDLELKFGDLNKEAKKTNMNAELYNKKFEALKKEALKWGVEEKMIDKKKLKIKV